MHAAAAMVVFQGGGYRINNGSGAGCAEFFADRGFLGVEVEYRTVEGPGECAVAANTPLYPLPFQDGARAMRLIRQRAAELGIDPNRIGVTGFSAGGHLAAILCGETLPCEAEEDDLRHVSFRPDICILGYPVLSLLQEHRGPGNLSGTAERIVPPDMELSALSVETRVRLGHPPCFMWYTRADAIVPYQQGELYAAALAEAGVPHKLVLYDEGPHALGLAKEGPYANDWTEQAVAWLGAWGRPQLRVPAVPL